MTAFFSVASVVPAPTLVVIVVKVLRGRTIVTRTISTVENAVCSHAAGSWSCEDMGISKEDLGDERAFGVRRRRVESSCPYSRAESQSWKPWAGRPSYASDRSLVQARRTCKDRLTGSSLGFGQRYQNTARIKPRHDPGARVVVR